MYCGNCAVLQPLFLFWFKLCLINRCVGLYIRFWQGCHYIKLINCKDKIRRRFLRNWRNWLFVSESTSLSSPQQSMPKSLADSDWRNAWMKSGGPHRIKQYLWLKKLSIEVSDLHSIFYLRQATASIAWVVQANQTVCWDIYRAVCLKLLKVKFKKLKSELSKYQSQYPINTNIS